jgi:hypothetical protein
MDMGSYLRRTGKTNLIDEELLILDVLFDSRDTFESLVKENYAGWHNLPYSHDLETGMLRDSVNKLIGKGIISTHTSGPDHRIFYGLTESGGNLWEVERAPNWEGYCMASSTVEENGNWMLLVESPSMATARAFLDCATHCHLYGFNQDEIRIATLIEENLSTVYWRVFPTVCSMCVRTYLFPGTDQADWKEYENKRTWWRDLAELARFQGL